MASFFKKGKGLLSNGIGNAKELVGEDIGTNLQGQIHNQVNSQVDQLKNQGMGIVQGQMTQVQDKVNSQVGQIQNQGMGIVQGQMTQVQDKVNSQVGQIQNQGMGIVQGQMTQVQDKVNSQVGQIQNQGMGLVQGQGQFHERTNSQLRQTHIRDVGKDFSQAGRVHSQSPDKINSQVGHFYGTVRGNRFGNTEAPILNLPSRSFHKAKKQYFPKSTKGHVLRSTSFQGRNYSGANNGVNYLQFRNRTISVSPESTLPRKIERQNLASLKGKTSKEVSNGHSTTIDSFGSPDIGSKELQQTSMVRRTKSMQNHSFDNANSHGFTAPDPTQVQAIGVATIGLPKNSNSLSTELPNGTSNLMTHNDQGTSSGVAGTNLRSPAFLPTTGANEPCGANVLPANAVQSRADVVESKTANFQSFQMNGKEGKGISATDGLSTTPELKKSGNFNDNASGIVNRANGFIGFFGCFQQNKKKKNLERSLSNTSEFSVTYKDTRGESCIHNYGSVIRIFMIAITVLVTIRAVTVSNNHFMWGAIPACAILLALEFAVVVFRRLGHEWVWWVPSLLIFLVTTLPLVWELQLNSMEMYKADPGMKTDAWTIAVSDAVVYLAIISRWMLQGGKITMASLGKVLLEFLANASDIMDLLSLTEEEAVRRNINLMYWVLAAWSLSFIKFIPLFDDVIINDENANGDDVFSDDSNDSNNGGFTKDVKSLPIWMQRSCGVHLFELVSMLISLFLLDGMFVVIRMYLVVVEDVVTFGIIFFIIKNSISIFMYIPKIFNLCVRMPCVTGERVDNQIETTRSTANNY